MYFVYGTFFYNFLKSDVDKEKSNTVVKNIKSLLTGVKDIEYNGKKIDIPFPLPFYPKDLAWQVNVDKTTFRKNEILNDLRKYLITATADGVISRQEAVSMLPPLFLDVQPHHKVLGIFFFLNFKDCCASPGKF